MAALAALLTLFISGAAVAAPDSMPQPSTNGVVTVVYDAVADNAAYTPDPSVLTGFDSVTLKRGPDVNTMTEEHDITGQPWSSYAVELPTAYWELWGNGNVLLDWGMVEVWAGDAVSPRVSFNDATQTMTVPDDAEYYMSVDGGAWVLLTAGTQAMPCGNIVINAIARPGTWFWNTTGDQTHMNTCSTAGVVTAAAPAWRTLKVTFTGGGGTPVIKLRTAAPTMVRVVSKQVVGNTVTYKLAFTNADTVWERVTATATFPDGSVDRASAMVHR